MKKELYSILLPKGGSTKIGDKIEITNKSKAPVTVYVHEQETISEPEIRYFGEIPL